MPLALNNNRGSVYSGRMKIEVPERKCLTELRPWFGVAPAREDTCVVRKCVPFLARAPSPPVLLVLLPAFVCKINRSE